MHTNNTAHYNLPQFIGSDIPNPLTDWNDSMQDIDTAMYEIKTQADEIGSDIVDDEADIDDLQSQANLTDDNITLLNQQTTAARSAATDAQDAANRNASNIATLQQSVTNNRTSITQYNNRFNQNVPFAFGIEEVEDPDNPGQTIEQYGFYTNDDPAEFVPFGEASSTLLISTGNMNSYTSPTITIDLNSLGITGEVTADNIIVAIKNQSNSVKFFAVNSNPSAAYTTVDYSISINNGTLTITFAMHGASGVSDPRFTFDYNIYFAKKITDLTS